jgi:hypothetical protein
MKNKFLQPIFTKFSMAIAIGTLLISQKVSAITIIPGGGINTVKDVQLMIQNTTTIALSVAGAVAGIFILLGGFAYLTAYGDQAKSDSGKKTLTWAITGLILVILSKVIVDTLWNFLAGTSAPSKIK